MSTKEAYEQKIVAQLVLWDTQRRRLTLRKGHNPVLQEKSDRAWRALFRLQGTEPGLRETVRERLQAVEHATEDLKRALHVCPV